MELVCETLGPVTDTLNQRLPLKQTVVTQMDFQCQRNDGDTAGRPTADARQRDEGHLPSDVVKSHSNTSDDSFLENAELYRRDTQIQHRTRYW